MGVEEVAQTYMGIPAASITSMDSREFSLAQTVRSSGKKKGDGPGQQNPDEKGAGNVGEQFAVGILEPMDEP